MRDGTLLAAVDLGSNSFRLEIGRYAAGHIERVQYFKEMVRQGAGLDDSGNLTEEAMQRRLAKGARVVIQRLDERGIADVRELMSAYLDALRAAEREDKAERLLRLLAARLSSSTGRRITATVGVVQR